MTILVTGATGLVGTRLLPRLVEAGIDVRALVRHGKSLPAGVTAVEGDILDAASLGAAVSGVDSIVHLAGLLRTPDTKQIWNVNLEGTRNLIEAAKANAPSSRFIMASTSLVYNDDAPRPSLESDDVAPTRDYPASKVAAEKLLRESGLNWTVLRFAFVYGDDDGHIGQIPHIAQLLKLHPANRLSMIHHRDIAAVTKLALAGSFDGHIVNTADDAPMTVLELSRIAGAPLEPDASPLTHPWAGVLDGSFARGLGFTPEVRSTNQAIQEAAL
ncbi:NAD-dependent epimerase/dehydratase family protein [Mesorhizobium sp. CO1-1-4]|uniref:NAD-dependent epimerase/dehydratase family protein n=1 Tax=Mesorhizobium sp. CO1-1-4 TaxID=2876633 RepID=UPI001CC9926E|nr:NAD(P)-dependent oxidoreductase [Mesorhizobium sp. CO1-1-4]MBZ9738325.1 NAD(P)-dependent oxidoreductase [Mesorhizobium sp. CO1-1-4]